MFLLGIASIFQIIIIPGLLFLKLLKIKTQSLTQSFLFTMGLSLYLNYLAVCFLTWQKLYTGPVVFALFLLELIILTYLIARGNIKLSGGKSLGEYYVHLKGYLWGLSSLHKLAFITASFFILFFISLIPLSTGASYYFTDALMHWTRWPLNWAANTFPTDSNHYPQLFPTNISLIYIFTGESGSQFFPKVLMPFFFLGILLMFFDLALWKRSLVHLTGFVIYAFLLVIFFNIIFILEVNADIPVAFFGFLAFYTILRQQKEGFDMVTILLVTIFASSAADTKLAGSYLLFLSTIWIIYSFYINWKNIKRQDIIRTAFYLLLVFCGSIFWYLVRPVDMVRGLDQSVYLVPDLYTRALRAANMVFFSTGPLFFIFISITLVVALFTREARHIILFIVLPASVLWAFFFSTDFRALSFVIPFIAYSSAYGMKFINDKLVKSQTTQIFPARPAAFNNKKLLSVLFLILMPVLFLLSGTDIFFSFGIKLANIINTFYFNSFRIISVTEVGYYKFIQYYTGSIKIMCSLLCIMFLLRHSSIRIWHIAFLIIIAVTIANFTWLKRENIRQMLINDAQMVNIHNLYYRIYSYINGSEQPSKVITNNAHFYSLVAPPAAEFVFTNEVNNKILSREQNGKFCTFLLIDKSKLNKEIDAFLNEKIKDKELSVCFHEEEFIFLRETKSTLVH